LGDDNFGKSLLDLWRTEGTNTEAVEITADAHTGVYFVTHGENGHEFSYLRAGSAASQMTTQWLEKSLAKELISNARVLHVSGISLALSPSAHATSLAAMRYAKSQGTLVSFDSNLRIKLWTLEQARQGILEAASLCDLFLPSLEDITTLTDMTDPNAIVDWGHALGASIVVLKLGADGVLISNGQRREHIQGKRVEFVDATGAGDCFCGNLLARITLGDDIFTATRYANAAASLAVQGFGAVAPLPRTTQVEAVLFAHAQPVPTTPGSDVVAPIYG
jgi:2-dehydro-3-deoxygluconokinase